MQNISVSVEQREPFKRMEWRLTPPVRVVIRNVAPLARDPVKAIFSALDHCGTDGGREERQDPHERDGDERNFA